MRSLWRQIQNLTDGFRQKESQIEIYTILSNVKNAIKMLILPKLFTDVVP